jgi:preprotein translocase subunit SecF
MINWMKFRYVYFAISIVFIAVGIFSIFKWGFKIGVDFTGGVVIEEKFEDGRTQTFKYGQLSDTELSKIREDFKNQKAVETRFENVGPVVGPELIKKTITALIISASLILVWVAYQFKSIKFGVSATIATFHDLLILLGGLSLLGHFFGAELDFLFVTAMLTVLSFSVHDTIVVYDRIREMQKKEKGRSIEDLANEALSQTMVRSLNNSFTIIFMLLALILMGGESVRWFSVALLIGTISGTYSSPFVAVPILVTWDKLVSLRGAKATRQSH